MRSRMTTRCFAEWRQAFSSMPNPTQNSPLRHRKIRNFLRVAALGAATLSFSTLASARDLQGRAGLGYNSEFSNYQETGGVPGISLKYAFTRDVAGELIFGVSTASPSNSVVAAKFFKNLFMETNLNFYTMLGGGLLTGGGKNGAEFLGGFGAEFFIPGIESLGLSMELGGSFSNLSGSFILRTMGVSFLNAGIRFYF